MKKTSLVVFCMLLFTCVQLANAEEIHSNGWVWPAGTDDQGTYKGWQGYLGHVGIDYQLGVGAPVYSLAHGRIVNYSSNLSNYGSACGGLGGAILAEHVAKGYDGFERTFYAVYGHTYIDGQHALGDIIEAGELLGHIHEYYGDDNNDGFCDDYWPHLHFGIKPDQIDQDKPFRGVCPSGGDCGWVDPNNFLDSNFPAASEVNCDGLQNKYPGIFQEEGIYQCIEARYTPPNRYAVWHYTYTGMTGYWGMVTTNFLVDIAASSPRVLGVSTTTPDDPGDTGSTDGPDGNVKRVELSNDKVNWHHTYTAYPGQSLEVEVNVTNKGDEVVDYFEVFVHRSPDKAFSHDGDYSYGREEESDDLAPGEGTNKHRTITAPTTPGKYYIFAYVNRVDGKSGGSDGHWENNISRSDDPEEYAILYVEVPAPWASFEAPTRLGYSPFTVQFYDTSAWSPTSWSWDFGDGQTSTVQHPAHVYTSSGIFTVSLTVSNAKGSTTATKTGYIKVDIPPAIRITNPTATDNWRSSDVKDIKWSATSFPVLGTVRIEYSLNDGASWRLIDSAADNDGVKHWNMCNYYTTNTRYGRIRITSNLYPWVQAISARFVIDHARGCK